MKLRFVPVLTLVLLAATMVGLALVPFSWVGWAYEYCGSHNCYCEPLRDAYFVRQPWTAMSNYGYLMAGVLIAQDLAGRRQGGTRKVDPHQQQYGYSFAAVVLAAGLFSFFSHASLTRVGEWLDLMGVYLITGFVAMYNLKRAGIWNETGRLAGYGLAMAAGGVQMALAPQLQQVVIGILLAAVVGTEITARVRQAPHGPNRYLLAALGLYGFGAVIWAITSRQGGCLIGPFPGHTLWHLLSAAAVGMMFLYYQRFQNET